MNCNFLLRAFFSGKLIPKLSVTALILLSVSFGSASKAVAQLAQVFGIRDAESQGYAGASALITTPNPNISPPYDWATGAAALSANQYYFIEAGATKACDYDCGLYPFTSWSGYNGNEGEVVVTQIALQPNSRQRYGVYYKGNQIWTAYFCDATGCYTLAEENLGTGQAFQFADSGGESPDATVQIGNVTTVDNRLRLANQSTWYNYCYNLKRQTVQPSGITTCSNAPEYSWTVSYPTSY